jgi:hypothetical protein
MFAASKSGRAVSAAATDPYFPYVPLLLETTSTNGQQNNTFLDSSTNNFTITRNGTPTQGSITPYWPNGYWSNNFPSAVNSYLTIAYNAAFNIASSTPFTIEFWFNTTGFGGVTNAFISGYNGAPSGWTVSFLGASNVFNFGLGDTTILTSASQTISVGVWYHFALVRNASNSISMYLNGTSIATPVTNSGAIGATSQGPWIGGTPGVGQYYHGYISNLRVVNGTGIVPPAGGPTSPLTAVTNTVLLTCQSNRFRDNSTNNFTLTPVSTPQVQAFQPFSPTASYTTAAYGGSAYFNGSGDYFSFGNPSINSNLNFGSNDFTVEAWVFPFVTTPSLIVGSLNNSTGAGCWWLVVNGTFSGGGTIQFGYNTTSGGSGTNILAGTGTLNVYSWSHVAVTRSGSSIRCFVNGIQVGTTNTGIGSSAIFPVNQALLIGQTNAGATYGMNGYISNLRLVNGTAVYTANFTPPTAPVTAITNTSLLTNFTNAGIYDAAAQNNAITVGSAQASTTVAKWSPTSMKFNGTTDYLTMPTSPAFGFGTGDCTIEMWLYTPNAASGGTQELIDLRTTNTATPIALAINSTGYPYAYNGTVYASSVALVNSTWNYLAFVRSGSATNNCKLYLNGTQVAQFTDANNWGSTNTCVIGRNTAASAEYFNGYLQDVRITKGYARTITTPTAAFPTR